MNAPRVILNFRSKEREILARRSIKERFYGNVEIFESALREDRAVDTAETLDFFLSWVLYVLRMRRNVRTVNFGK